MTKKNNIFHKRVQQYQHTLGTNQAVLLAAPSDITYFTGFTFLVPEEREALLCITSHATYLMHTSFAELPPHSPAALLVGCTPTKIQQHLATLAKSHDLSELLVDTSSLFVDEYQALQNISTFSLNSLDKKALWQLRVIKDETEVAHVITACKIAMASFKAIQPTLKPGVTEQEVQLQLEAEMRQRGSERPAFPTIVCFGSASALPHHQPTDTTLSNNMPVLFDFGATVHGYRSDMSRSWWFGKEPSAEYQKVETIVKTAYQTVLDQLTILVKGETKPTAKDLDLAARDYIKAQGFGQKFIHTTGHGVGLDIHEPPSLHWQNPSVLKPGMVVTIEPGIYLPNQFGYRYENTVLLTETGYQELSFD